jgi:hypothetical protein
MPQVLTRAAGTPPPGSGLGRDAGMGVIVNTKQRRHVVPIPPKRRAGGGGVADLQRIVGVERPHILEIFDGEVLQVNEKNSFAGTAATGGDGASLVTPGSNVAPF